jgi:hypothetical protein
MIYNHGIIQGELFKHETRQSVIDYISTLDLTPEQKNGFYAYWKSIQIMQTIARQMAENKRLRRLRR